MSFVDPPSLAFYRRNEMAARIGVFVEKCDHAIRNVNKLKMQAQGFVENFNCGVASESDPKERFLNCLKQLDEFTYFITDFNLTMSKFDSLTLEDCKLPAQTILQIDHVYPATVMSTDGISSWVITDEVNEVLE